MDQLTKLMTVLREQIDNDTLTVARYIETETFVCFTEKLPHGMVNYHQMLFDSMPSDIRDAFRGHSTGDRIGRFKIVSIWDAWVKEDACRAPMGKIRVNQ